MLKLVVIYFILIIVHIAAVSDCGQAEEGKEYNLWLNGTLKNTNQEISVRQGDIFIAKCVPALECESFDEKSFSIFITLAVNHQFSVNVKIVNITRNHIKTWHTEVIDDGSLLASCSLLTFSRPENVTCGIDKGASGINVTCITTKIYPRAKCDFLVYVNEKKRQIDISIIYKHYEFKDNEIFFSSSCTFRILRKDIEIGIYEIIATLTPEISKNGEEMNYGSIMTIPFVIESPKVKLQNCPKIVLENSEASCMCTSLNSFTSYTIRWYNNHGDLVQEGSLVNFTANKTIQEYLCEGTDYLGLKSQLVVYKPSLFEIVNHAEDKERSRLHQLISVSTVAAAFLILILSAVICVLILVKKKRKQRQKAIKRPWAFKISENRLSIESNHEYHTASADDHYDKCDSGDYERSLSKENIKVGTNLQQMLNTEYITPIIEEHSL